MSLMTDDDPFVVSSVDKETEDVPQIELSSSPAEVMRTLQEHLEETQRRKMEAGRLGENLVAQELELRERIQELEEGLANETIDSELRQKLSDLERDYMDLGRETSRVVLSSKRPEASPFGGSNLSSSPSMLESHGAGSPAKLIAQVRRQRNPPPSRRDDLEFAAELGQGLIAEVRKLQGLLSEREEALKALREEKSELDQQMRTAQARLKQMDDSEGRYKEENWNLELSIQDLRSQISDYKDAETRLHAQISALQDEKREIDKQLDELRQQHGKLLEEHDHMEKHFDHETTVLRRNLTSTETERDKLQQKVKDLAQELEEANKVNMRLQLEAQRHAEEDRGKGESESAQQQEEESPDSSPPVSPLKNTPKHNPGLELETLKSSLHHAHRMITNLKSNIHREKTEKAELKRLLQDARDELENARNGFGSPIKEKVRRRETTLKKPTRVGMNLIGGARKSRENFFMQDDEWEELNGDGSDEANRSSSPTRRAPGAYNTTTEAESAFETANEKETTDAFETATENNTATETEAYRTGAESPVNDNPTSADDLTETENRSVRTIRGKSSNLSRGSRSSGGSRTRSRRFSSNSGSRPPRYASRIRNRLDSVASTGSTEDEYESGHRYTSMNVDSDTDVVTPEGQWEPQLDSPFTPNPRLKIPQNRMRGRHNIFNTPNYDDNHASSMDEMSPLPRRQNRPSTLFAELDAAGNISSDPGEEYDDGQATELDTPSRSPRRSSTPALRARVEMVDSSMNTEEPYPEIVVTEPEPEKPASTTSPITAVLDFAPVEVPARLFSDAHIQSDEEPKPSLTHGSTQADFVVPVTSSAGTQSDPEPEPPVIPTSEASTQSEVKPVSSSGVQSEGTRTTTNGTQSDAPRTTTSSTQFDVKPTNSSGIQSEPEPEAEPVILETFQQTVISIEPIEPVEEPVVVPVPVVVTPEPQPEPEVTEEPVAIPSEVFIGMGVETTPVEPEAVVEEKPVSEVAYNTTAEIIPVEPEVIKSAVSVNTTAEIEPIEPEVVKAPESAVSVNVAAEIEPIEPEVVEVPESVVAYSTTAEIVPIEPEVVVVPESTVSVNIAAEITPVEPVVPAPEPAPESSIVFHTQAEIVPEPQAEKVVIAPVVAPLELSPIITVEIEPVEPEASAQSAAVAAVTAPAKAAVAAVAAAAGAVGAVAATQSADAGLSSDEETPRKVSETVEDQQASTALLATPEKKGFFGSLFGSQRKAQNPRTVVEPETGGEVPGVKEQQTVESESDRDDTIRVKESAGRAKLSDLQHPAPAPITVSQMVQTEISSEYFDRIEKDSQLPKPVLAGGVRVVPATPSIRSKASQESVGVPLRRTSTDGSNAASTIKRPGSSSSMREQQRVQHPPLPPNHQEQIAAAQQEKLPAVPNTAGPMGPPAVPSNSTLRATSASSALRPYTPQTRPDTPASRSGATPRAAKYSSIRSGISSPTSRRSSLSSFASELDDRFNMQYSGYPTSHEQPTTTDPKVIQAITQTMIGDYLWKYTRSPGRGISGSRHRRFFWVHPYTRTLYWSDRDPQSAGRNELRAKSVAIEAIRVVTDDNTSPPGLCQKSLVILTPGRTIKFTAPTSALHETWFSALSYLLLRTGEAGHEVVLDGDDIQDYHNYTPSRVQGSNVSSMTTRPQTPSLRARSSLSHHMDAQRHQGSMSRLSNIFRTSSTFSSRYNPSEMSSSVEDVTAGGHTHTHTQAELDRMENVRACCDGKHDVGTLPRKSGKKIGHPHQHHHHHHHRQSRHRDLKEAKHMQQQQQQQQSVQGSRPTTGTTQQSQQV